MEYDEGDSSASTADMEDHVELDTDNGSASIGDMTDIEHLYTDHDSPSMDNMVDHHSELDYNIDDMVEHYLDYDYDTMMEHRTEHYLDYDYDTMMEHRTEHYLDYDYDTMMEHRTEHYLDYDIDTMVEPNFNTTLHKTDGATMRVLTHMIIYIELVLWNNKSVPAMIAIDTLLRAQEGATSKVPSYMNHHLGMLRIVIDTRHLMIVVDHHHLMFAINQHLPRIFDDTPQDMVMMQEDESLDMKRPRLQRKMVASANREEPHLMVPPPPTATTTMAPTRSSSPKMKTMESTLQDEGRSTHLYANMTMVRPPRPRSSQCFRCTQDGHLWECPNLHCDVCTSNKHMTWECNTPQAHKLYFAQLDAQFANMTLQDTIVFKEWCKEMDKSDVDSSLALNNTIAPSNGVNMGGDGVEKVEHGIFPSTKEANGVENGEHGMIPSPMEANGVENGEHGMIPSPMEAHGDDKIEPTPICLNDEMVPIPCEHESHLAHLSESDSELSDSHPICEFECFHLEDMSDTQSELREVDNRSMEDIAFANTLTSPSFVSSYVAIGSMEDEFPIMEKMYMVHEDDDITPCLQEVKDVDHMDPTTSTTPTSNESDYKGNYMGVDDAMIPLVDMMTYECMHDLEDTIAMPHASFIPPCDALLDNIVDHVDEDEAVKLKYEEEPSIARGGEEQLDKKLDVKLDKKLDVKLDVKTSHGRAREEREACARGGVLQAGPRAGLTGRGTGQPGPKPDSTPVPSGIPGALTLSPSARSRSGCRPDHPVPARSTGFQTGRVRVCLDQIYSGYKAHQDPGEEDKPMSREGEKQLDMEMIMKPKPTSPEELQGRDGRWPVQDPVRPDPQPDSPKKDPSMPVTWMEYEALRDHLTRELRVTTETFDTEIQGVNLKVEEATTAINTVQTSMTTLQASMNTLTQAVQDIRTMVQQQPQQPLDEDGSVNGDNADAAAAQGMGRGVGRGLPRGVNRGFVEIGARRVPQQQDDGLGKPKFSIPRFEGTTDVEEYLTWELKIERLWRLHPDYTEDRKIKLASSEFDGYALRWWDALVQDREEDGELPIITWRTMKAAMRARFVPTNYLRSVFDKLTQLKQGVLTVDAYYMEMEMLMQRARVRESLEMTLQRFLNGLKFNIKGIVRHHKYATMNELLHHAREAESQLAEEAQQRGRATGAGRYTPRPP
ncbi:hypothetical protein QYE76_027123 [Lolium multiflorum]|uniref:Retrotransposon gag domain-containing protein n=1 Tax=Lolium multiflorum TaxID=4521 RepID=A0AAD8QG38_LOLMU|nr:hypothetical protein QYE76_027123 [Lolium multiflorum]